MSTGNGRTGRVDYHWRACRIASTVHFQHKGDIPVNISLTPPPQLLADAFSPCLRSISSQSVGLFRLTLIALSLTLLVACGGGGGGTASVAPTTGDGGGGPAMPTGPVDLPAALIANASVAMSNVSGSAVATTTMPTEIQAAFEREAMDADTLLNSDAFVRNMSSSNGADMSTEGNITLDDFTFRSSLENIKMGIADRFNLEGVRSQYSPVMDHQEVTLAQYQAAGRTDGSDVLEYQSYGGWLTNSAFSVDMLKIDPGSNESSALFGISYGDATGTRPATIASYDGSIVGISKDDGNVIQGDFEMDVSVSNNTANIDFLNVVNISDGSDVEGEWMWRGVTITPTGTFSSETTGDINGTFYGMGHAEVGGTFNRNRIIGAFGGRKQ